jgi:ribose-phosphate pyrophosphokinase
MIIDLNEISRTSFPAGERNVVSWKNQFNPGNHPEAVRAVLRSSDDIMDLMLLTDILKRQGHPANKLILPYVPYARQDRATTEDTAFSLGVMANMINSLEYKEVHVFEPHSYVTQAVINNCVVHSSNDAIFEYMMCITNQNSDIVLVAPDASAVKKAESFNE